MNTTYDGIGHVLTQSFIGTPITEGTSSAAFTFDALVESVNGLYKTELNRAWGPWRTADQLELATAAWVAWWYAERLHSACGDAPPAEFEAAYHSRRATSTAA